mmetsp:Transcript_17854/g.23511  ORF Transcript_17854/g.23511 Transcript_17854/m.23511 type:complete len:431 (-) Transcript_17854:1181-2473(-)
MEARITVRGSSSSNTHNHQLGSGGGANAGKKRKRGRRGGRKRNRGLPTAAEEEALAKEKEMREKVAVEEQEKLQQALQAQVEHEQEEINLAPFKKSIPTWRDKPRRKKEKLYLKWMKEGEEDPFEFLDKIGRHYPVDQKRYDPNDWPISGVDGCWRCPGCGDVNFPRRWHCYGKGCKTHISEEAFQLVLEYVAEVKAMLKMRKAADDNKYKLRKLEREREAQRAATGQWESDREMTLVENGRRSRDRCDVERGTEDWRGRTRDWDQGTNGTLDPSFAHHQSQGYWNHSSQNITDKSQAQPGSQQPYHNLQMMPVLQQGNVPGELTDREKERMRRLESYNSLRRQGAAERVCQGGADGSIHALIAPPPPCQHSQMQLPENVTLMGTGNDDLQRHRAEALREIQEISWQQAINWSSSSAWQHFAGKSNGQSF